MPSTDSSVTPQSLLQSWRSPFPFQRGKTRHLFQSVGMMPVFQAEHRTACNDKSTTFPPALKSSAWMPQIPGALHHFNRFTAACVSTNEDGSQVIGGSAIGIVTSLTFNSTAGWIGLEQLPKATDPAGLHFRLLCQKPQLPARTGVHRGTGLEERNA